MIHGKTLMWIISQQAEIERLRAALQKIADLVDSEAGEPLDDAIDIAKAALASNAEQTGDIK